MAVEIPAPQLQVDFAFALEQIRQTYLQDALSQVVSSLDVTLIDAKLAHFAPGGSLARLAGHGLHVRRRAVQ
jgi:hypothetical protein